MTNETNIDNDLFVRSHVPRDLLQSAALFKTDKSVIWEYVSNGLQYVDEGINPIVHVTIESKKKRISIEDNGRGMNWKDLQNFFIMHGENIDRKLGRPGRGLFGTGKSAAFGIAERLSISTVRNRKLSKIELTRGNILKMNSEGPIPVEVLEREKEVDQPNGTFIEIENIHLKSFDQAGIIHFIERQLARWKNATVFVNNHECEFAEPPSRTQTFSPEESIQKKIGDVTLIIKIAGAPLDEEFRGVSIYSNGIWYETTLAGNEGREMAQYIFGEIEVPKLDEDTSPISPFDISRSMKLNANNEIVQTIYSFIGQKIDLVRRQLLAEEKERKASEDAKKLASHAETIAEVINNDFDEFRKRLAKVKAKVGKGFDYGPEISGDLNSDDLLFGSQVPAEIINPIGDLGSQGGTREGGIEPRNLNPQVIGGNSNERQQGRFGGGKEGHSSSRGGFNVEFKTMGAEESRAIYTREERTIYVNLDHPQLVAAKGNNSVEDPLFRKISYEVAFSEYAIALAHELDARDEYMDPSDPILDIRETINRIARKATSLFAV